MSERNPLSQTLSTEGSENNPWPVLRFGGILVLSVAAVVATLVGIPLASAFIGKE